MKNINVKVCIIGGGAGGYGCAYRLAKNEISTAVIEKNEDFGGTAVFGGVNCWEPGVSFDGVHLLLKDELMKIENGCMVAETVPNGRLLGKTNEHSFEKYPWGLSVKSKDSYESTLKRCKYYYGTDPSKHRRFQFDAFSMQIAMNNVLAPYKKYLHTLFNTEVTDVLKDGDSVTAVICGGTTITADCFVDCTGNIVLARKLGCKTSLGSESADAYGEPSAGKKPDMNINGATYVFRIKKTEDKNHIDEIPQEYEKPYEHENLRTVSCFNMYPNGDINVNMLPTMSGQEYLSLGEKADFYGKTAVYHYWRHLQENKGLRGYTLCRIFNAGIRESYRLVGKYVLTENDINAGILKQKGNIIAAADHALDMHGKGGGCREVEMPYGIPVECCMTNEYKNLFVACRGASFSHIAASSARLSRTMLSLGEGLGEYLAEIITTGSFSNKVCGDAKEKFTENL